MTQEKSPMESRNLCGKNVAKFRNLLAGSPSQEKLAAKMQLEGLNINKNAIQRIECGKRMVKDIELDVFAKIFHVSVDELMYGQKKIDNSRPGSMLPGLSCYYIKGVCYFNTAFRCKTAAHNPQATQQISRNSMPKAGFGPFCSPNTAFSASDRAWEIRP